PRATAQGFTVADGRRHPAELEMSSEGIRAKGGDVIPWNRVKLARDEADDALLVIGRGIVLGSTDDRFLRDVEGLAGNELDREISRLTGQTTGLPGTQIVGCIAFFALIVYGLLQVPGCYRGAVDRGVNALDPSIDRQLGEAALESAPGGTEIESEIVLDAIEEMVAALEPHFGDTDIAASEVEWQIRVIDDDETINAYALPGGFITVYTGLIEAAETPDMVAGVIAHEMAHVLQRHGLKRVANKAGLFIGLSLLVGNTSGLIGLSDILLDSGYSRTLESEADDVGVKAMARTGLDARSLARFFEILRDEYGDLPPLMQWIGSHPDHQTRIESIEAILVEMEDEAPPARLELDWDAVLAELE
ncbi:MAG: M48 family metallopeptidase, partial [Planctomycetota bacterium]